MKKLLYLLLLLPFVANAQVNIGSDGKVHTSSPGANTVTTNVEIQGGYYGTVADITAMNALSSYLLLPNTSRVTVMTDTTDYIYNGTSWFQISKGMTVTAADGRYVRNQTASKLGVGFNTGFGQLDSLKSTLNHFDYATFNSLFGIGFLPQPTTKGQTNINIISNTNGMFFNMRNGYNLTHQFAFKNISDSYLLPYTPTASQGNTLLTRGDTSRVINKDLSDASNILGGVSTAGFSGHSTGDLYYDNGGVLTRLPIGSSLQQLVVFGGVPTWASPGNFINNQFASKQTGGAWVDSLLATQMHVNYQQFNNVTFIGLPRPSTLNNTNMSFATGLGSTQMNIKNGYNVVSQLDFQNVSLSYLFPFTPTSGNQNTLLTRADTSAVKNKDFTDASNIFPTTLLTTTGTTLPSSYVNSSLTSAAGGAFGSNAYSSVAYLPKFAGVGNNLTGDFYNTLNKSFLSTLSINGTSPTEMIDIYQNTAAYGGTVAITNGSNTITGTGTTLTQDLRPGDVITINGESQFIATVAANGLSATTLSNWGQTFSGTYTLNGLKKAYFTNKGTLALGNALVAINGTNSTLSINDTYTNPTANPGNSLSVTKIWNNNTASSNVINTAANFSSTISNVNTQNNTANKGANAITLNVSDQSASGTVTAILGSDLEIGAKNGVTTHATGYFASLNTGGVNNTDFYGAISVSITNAIGYYLVNNNNFPLGNGTLPTGLWNAYYSTPSTYKNYFGAGWSGFNTTTQLNTDIADFNGVIGVTGLNSTGAIQGTSLSLSGAITAAGTLNVGGITATGLNLGSNAAIAGNFQKTGYDGLHLLVDDGSTILKSTLQPMTTLGDIIYGGVSGVATRLPGNTTTTQKFLTQTGTGSASGAPAYFDLFGTANSFLARQSFSDGTQGLQIGAYTGGSGYGAIYPYGVTPNSSNYAFTASTSVTEIANTTVNVRAATTANILIGGVNYVTVTNAGTNFNGSVVTGLAAPSGSTDATNKAYVDALNKTLVSNDYTGLNSGSSPTLATYSVPANGNYQITAYLYVTAVTGGSTGIYANYTDQNGFTQTVNFSNMGSTATSFTTLGPSQFPTVTIRAKAGTSITILHSASGTITFDAGANIKLL